MSTFILTFLRSSVYQKPSGLKLADLAKFTAINNFRNITNTNDSSLIRYGITSYAKRDLQFKTVLNKADDIRRSMNKLLCSRYLLLHGVISPKIWIDKDRIREEDLPVLRRRRFHSRGRDIIYIGTSSKLRRICGDYFVKFVLGIAEYRLHVINGKPIRLQKKALGSEGEEHYIRNVDHGYVLLDHYKHDIELEIRIIQEAIKAIKLMNMDFGAIDVLIGEDGLPYILEINSAPRLSKFGRHLYAYWFNEVLGNDPSIEDYDWLRWNEGRFSNGLESIKIRKIIKTDEQVRCYE